MATGPALPTVDVGDPTAAVAPVSARRAARRETLRLLLRRPEFLIGVVVVAFWVVCAVGGDRIAPRRLWAAS